MNNHNSITPTTATHKPRPLIDLLVSIVIPSVILMKFSGAENLGASTALIVALAFPLSWGLFEFYKYRQFNFIALLGLISVFLTGGIGLLQLDPQWLAIKEAAIPGLIGVAVLMSTYTRYPLIKTLLYNPKVIDVDKIGKKLNERDKSEAFETRLQNATYLLSSTFLFSSAMNYILAKWLVTSPAGSAAFNEELGQMTLLSYPVITIPVTLMMIAIFYYLWRTINGLTGLTLEEILATQHSKGQQGSTSV
jgi:intracellular septation protein A